MKIMWVCNIYTNKIASCLDDCPPSSGGWLEGIAQGLCDISDDITIIYCFPYNKKVIGNIGKLIYYSFPYDGKNDLQGWFVELIESEKPDCIHIFGTEFEHSLIAIEAAEEEGFLSRTVINIQGLTSFVALHYYAGLPNCEVYKYTLRDLIKNDSIAMQQKKMQKRGLYELKTLQKAQHVIGRTEWDKACAKMINPVAQYHFCNETLREVFYNHHWNLNDIEKHSIFVSQASYPIKGFHIVLEAMDIVKKKYPDATLYTTGRNPLECNTLYEKLKQSYYQRYLAKLIKEYRLENSVMFLGRLDEVAMCRRYLKTHVFVSASSIENSPNSVGEAMLLGVPVVSSDVGGVKSMINHGETGFLYPFDESYMLAYYICQLFESNDLAECLSKNEIEKASHIFNRLENALCMIDIYQQIVDNGQ